MSARRVLLLIISGVAGYIVLAFIFPFMQPVAQLGVDLDRHSVIALARKHAVSIEPEAAAWPAGVEPVLDQSAERYLEDKPKPELAGLMSVVSWRVTLPDPRSRKRIEVTINGKGRTVGVSRQGWTPDATRTVSTEEQKNLAEAALKQLASDQWQSFRFKQSSMTDSATRTFVWERGSDGDDRINFVANASLQNDVFTRTSISPELSNDYRARIRSGRSILRWMDIGFVLLLLLGALFALVIYFRNVIRKEVRHSSTFLAWLVSFAAIAVWLINSSMFEDIRTSIAFSSSVQSSYLRISLSILTVSAVAAAVSLPISIFWGAGYPEASRLVRNPLSRFELFLRGKFLARKVGSSILVGLALGWAFPLIAFAAAKLLQVGETPRLAIERVYGDLFTARIPLLVRPLESSGMKLYTVFIVFVFLLPFLLHRFRKSAVCHGIAIFLGALSFLGTDEFHTGVAAAVFSSLAAVVFLDRLVFKASFLAALIALLSGDFAMKLCALQSQPSLNLQWHGWVGWALFGLAIAGSAAVALRGRVLSEEDARARWFIEDQPANREELAQLKAQFQVARRAQEQMLPDEPPIVPGVEIAAVCQPAREVGGDLFDFLQLPNGRIGIVVADVSGKGVPAALYMTLTKGLLASVAETTSDPAEIVREVNRHLYVACKRKMFVTLLLGVVDPESRRFAYVRAGHNPPVWRNGTNRETTLLGARGIGLGLTSGELFDRTLELEEIALRPGDLLLLYSDGISEAMNEAREEYGETRLKAVAGRADGMSAEKVKDLILADVRSFLGRTPPQDDQTLVVVKVLN